MLKWYFPSILAKGFAFTAVAALGFQLAIIFRDGVGDKMVCTVALLVSIFSVLTKTDS